MAESKRCLTARQRRLLEIVEELGFGRIEQISIDGGEPRFLRETRIVQEIKLGSEFDHQFRQPYCGSNALTLKKEFEALFAHLERLRDGIVDIEIRHSRPFRLIIDRGHGEVEP